MVNQKGYRKIQLETSNNHHKTYAALKQQRNPPSAMAKTVAVFGPMSTGKTRLTRALTENTSIETTPTSGMILYPYHTHRVVFDVHDIGGARRFKVLWHSYLKPMHHILLVFNDDSSFYNLEEYIAVIHNTAPNADITLVHLKEENLNLAPVIFNEKIQGFMKKHAITAYRSGFVDDPFYIDNLRTHLIETALKGIPQESQGVINAKEAAKIHINALYDLATLEPTHTADAVRALCAHLDNILLSAQPNLYLAENEALIKEHLETLQYTQSSLFSSALNITAMILVCAAAVATLGIASIWLADLLKKNHDTKGDYFLFSTKGEKQRAQETLHQTKATTPQKKG